MLGLIIGVLLNGAAFLILHTANTGSFPKPLSSKEEEKLLIQMEKGSKKARNKLIEHNLRLVAHIIKKYYTNISDQDDVVSIGSIGLIKAVDSFDRSKGIKLSSYASRCIENEILMFFRNAKKSAQDISMNESIENDRKGKTFSLIDVMVGEDIIIDNIDTKIKCEKLYEYIKTALSDTERKIIELRYGMNGKKQITQREVAEMLNISRSYVSRIEKRALGILKKTFEENS